MEQKEIEMIEAKCALAVTCRYYRTPQLTDVGANSSGIRTRAKPFASRCSSGKLFSLRTNSQVARAFCFPPLPEIEAMKAKQYPLVHGYIRKLLN
jgi:hypothetical protein